MHRREFRFLVGLLVALSAVQLARAGQQSVQVPINTVFPSDSASLLVGTVAVLPDSGGFPQIKFSFMPPRNYRDGGRITVTVYYAANPATSGCNFLLFANQDFHWQPGQDVGATLLPLNPTDGSDTAPAQPSDFVVQTESYEFPTSFDPLQVRRGDIVFVEIGRDSADPLDTCNGIDVYIAGLRVDYTSR